MQKLQWLALLIPMWWLKLRVLVALSQWILIGIKGKAGGGLPSKQAEPQTCLHRISSINHFGFALEKYLSDEQKCINPIYLHLHSKSNFIDIWPLCDTRFLS